MVGTMYCVLTLCAPPAAETSKRIISCFHAQLERPFISCIGDLTSYPLNWRRKCGKLASRLSGLAALCSAGTNAPLQTGEAAAACCQHMAGALPLPALADEALTLSMLNNRGGAPVPTRSRQPQRMHVGWQRPVLQLSHNTRRHP